MPTDRDDDEKDSRAEPPGIIGGALNIFGIKIDLGQLLSTPAGLAGQLDELRERLKQAGGEEVLSGDVWKQGGASVSGHIRTRGILGDQEFHIGTTGRAGTGSAGRPAPTGPEVMEPPVDVFDDEEGVTVVADVPGVVLDDLDIKIEGRVFSLTTRAAARRSYQKELLLEGDMDPESLQVNCHNGVLEVRLRKKGYE